MCEPMQSSVDNKGATGKGKKLLIVEDDPAIRETLAELLEIEGYSVDIAANGQEAMKYLLSASLLPDLIILDLMMPVMDGYQFRNEQKKLNHLASIPTIIMTADGKIADKQKSTNSSAYLKKPLDFNAVMETVKQYCG